MTFLYPWFLLALAAISIPIIIHLFHFRRFKKVYFSNISFLQRLSDETQKQAKLRHLLVLFSRILAISFLVMAFARPYIPLRDADEGTSEQLISVYIDNSFSMEAGPGIGNLLEQARQNGEDIVGLFQPTDQFQLLTNDLEARHQRFTSRDEFLRMLNEVSFSPAVRTIPEVVQRQTDLFREEPGNNNRISFILSDFQKITAHRDELQPDSITDYFFIPFHTERLHNLFIDSVWIENPVRLAGQVITIDVRVYNDSDQRLENQPVRLFINDTQRSVATFSVGPHSHADVSLNYTLGDNPLQQGFVEITDHPVTFDDRYYFSFSLSQDIPVMVINQASPNRFLNALFSADTTFILRNVQVGAIDYSLMGSQNLIILNEVTAIGSGLAAELRRYVSEGGNLLIFPAENPDLASYNELLSALQVAGYDGKDDQPTRVTALNELHTIYGGVFDRLPENLDLPSVDQYYIIERQTRGREQYLMQLQNGNYFFTSTPSGQGMVYLSAVAANDRFSNFHRHAMFVPTVYNIALHSSTFYPLSYTIGQEETILIRNYQPEAGSLFTISGNQMEIIPESRNLGNNIQLLLHNQVQNHGNYSLGTNNELMRTLSFNYNRRESMLESLNSEQLSDISRDFENIYLVEPGNVSLERQMELLKGGRHLWRLFLLIGLLFLVAEVVLLRLFK
ncbi:MAG: BatA domain-containing protein [Bacteroidota bacterium]